ncbi:MAG: Ig-like domain-containing protein, partial [Gemmatimonadaceae bacterium]
MRFTGSSQSILSAVVIVTMIACADASGPKTGPPATIALVSGDAQRSTQVGTKLPLPLTIKVSDAEGLSLSGVAVTWATSSGTLRAASSRTDRNGIATTEWTLGSIAG